MRCAFDLNSIPDCLTDCLGRWIRLFPKHDKKLVVVGAAAMFWTIWRCRNDSIFERKTINNPLILVRLMCLWIADWSILQTKEPETRLLKLGARLVERVANAVYRASQGWRPGVLRIGG